jgi:hypothetical protein
MCPHTSGAPLLVDRWLSTGPAMDLQPLADSLDETTSDHSYGRGSFSLRQMPSHRGYESFKVTAGEAG